jgi:hypothetical protein
MQSSMIGHGWIKATKSSKNKGQLNCYNLFLADSTLLIGKGKSP